MCIKKEEGQFGIGGWCGELLFPETTVIQIICCMYEKMRQRCQLLSNTLKPSLSMDQVIMGWTTVNLDTLVSDYFGHVSDNSFLNENNTLYNVMSPQNMFMFIQVYLMPSNIFHLEIS